MNASTSPAAHRSVLADRLQLALEAPERAASWHWLYEALERAETLDRHATLNALVRSRPHQGMGAMLAATVMDSFAADGSELAQAAHACCNSALPLDAGLALMHTMYARGLRDGGNVAGLAASLKLSGFVDVARHVGERLRARGAQRQVGAAPAAAAQRANSRTAQRGQPARRVAVVAPTLSTGFHAPTQMALAHACALLEQGLDVSVFSPQEFLMPRMADWLGTPRNMAIDLPERSRWPTPAVDSLHVALVNLSLSMGGRWVTLLAAIDQFAPDAVLFIGPYSPLLWPLHARYPVLGLGTNAVCPVGPLDLWLAPQPGATSAWQSELGQPAVQAHTQRLRVDVPRTAASSARDDLPRDAVLWLTSGSRLKTELTPVWTAGVMAALEHNPQVHWLLVGKVDSLPAQVPRDHPRVHLRSFDKTLDALMLGCDLYLNPPRIGGGFSVAMAMASGLPVLSLQGSDGGDKLGPMASADEAAYLRALDSLSRDADARRAAGAAQRARFDSVFNLRHAGRGLLAALSDTIQLAQRRLAVAA